MKRTGRGFTLIELVIVLLVTSVIIAIAFYALRSFMTEKLSVSNHVRSLTIALQQARMRALASKTYANITQHQSSDWDDSLKAYKTVRFTSTKHGFDPGDYVTFAGLTDAHTGMNGGTYQVKLEGFDADNFECPFYHTTSQSRTETTPYPKARNLSRASKLVIMKLSDVLVSTDSVVTSFRDDPKNTILKERPEWALISQRAADYYIYNAEGVRIRDTLLNDVVTLSFDSRGFAFNDGGYEVWVDAVTDTSGVLETRARSVVSVNPFGMVRPGR